MKHGLKLQIKSIFSPDLPYGVLPTEPSNCSVSLIVDIGVAGKRGGDQFIFEMVTPEFLILNPKVFWGRFYLILPEFSWIEVENSLSQLVQSVQKESWEEAAQEISKTLKWEYENYRES